MLRVLIISNIPTPSNDALFGQLAGQPGVELKVVYCAWTESNRLWTLGAVKPYDYTVLRGWSIGRSGHVNPQIGSLIAAWRPDVAVLSGSYAMPTVQYAARRLRAERIPWVYWGEQLRNGGARMPRRILRNVLRRTVRRANGVFAIGTRATTSYVQAGMKREWVADFRYYPDFHQFRLAPEAREAARLAMRSRLRIAADTTVFVFCGQMIHRKGVDTLLQAQAAVRRKSIPCITVLVGDGKEQHALQHLAASLDLADDARFVGFVQPADLPRYLVAGDVLVLPSRREGWGLVVPEAMAAGLPVIASDQVNAAVDLIQHGHSGYVVPVEDASALADAMYSLCESPMLLAEMAGRARVAAERENPSLAATRMVTLLHGVIKGSNLNEL